MVQQILDIIEQAITAMWFYFETMLNEIDGYAIVFGLIASAVFTRFVIMPIFGGKIPTLGSDIAKERR